MKPIFPMNHPTLTRHVRQTALRESLDVRYFNVTGVLNRETVKARADGFISTAADFMIAV